jgi:hypothetical protein
MHQRPSGGFQSDQTIENLFDQIKDLQERLAQLERHALTSQNIQGKRISIDDEISVSDLDDGDLVFNGRILNRNLASFIPASAITSLPYLRAAWDLGQMRDTGPHFGSIEGHGLDLTNVGIQALNYNNIISCGNWGIAGTDRAYAADGANWDIQGNENYVTTSYRGLTIGAWVRFVTTFATGNVIGKWTYTGNQRAYNLRIDGTGTPIFYISSDGTATTFKGSSEDLVEDEWSFLVGRFRPSSAVKIYHGKKGVLHSDENTTSIPATIANTTAQFEIGSYNGGGGYWQGQIAWPFVCFGAVPDVYITRYFEMTRRAFEYVT